MTDQAPLPLQFEGVTVAFRGAAGEVPVVDDLSFSLGRGEVVGMLGESGSGKSLAAFTAIGMLPRGAHLVAGSVLVHGRAVASMSDRELRRLRGSDVALIFQEPMTALSPVRRIEAQLYDLLRWHRGMTRAAAREHACRLLADLRVPDPERVLAAYAHQLSGGLRQRVLIAMALACDPAVFIADEITTAIDACTRREVLQLLGDQVSERHAAMLIISHDIGVIGDVSQRAIVMYRGEIVEQGPTRELLSLPLHPYTVMLLGATPDGRPPKSRLATAPARTGTVAPRGGCRFIDRCTAAEPGCRQPQALLPITSDRLVRCWKAGVGG